MFKKNIKKYRYVWPYFNLAEDIRWKKCDPDSYVRQLPETIEDISLDSRWPAFFPCAICYVTTTDGKSIALEKVVGASIVNRFPYVIALSFCIENLSKRHYARNRFTKILEKSGVVAIHYFEPGPYVDAIDNAIKKVSDDEIENRISYSGLPVRTAVTNESPVFTKAYMVYEARLVKRGVDFNGDLIFDQNYTEFGSHRIYYFEIEAIQLREDIAKGDSQIYWQALPYWNPRVELHNNSVKDTQSLRNISYEKGYSPEYFFPSANTVAFEYNDVRDGMAIKLLPALPKEQIEIDNDRARWPCFFPSSAGLITTWDLDGTPNLMPCGSTTVFVRKPFCLGICVSYANINIRYAPRATLRALNKRKRFACSVPFNNKNIVSAIKYAGNISVDKDKDKVENAGLHVQLHEWAPRIMAAPITFYCEVVETVRLGTHFLYLGEVISIQVREDVTCDNPLEWYPLPDMVVGGAVNW